MTYLQIVLNIPLNQTFTYSYIPQENEKAELKPEIGKRAEIRFGNRKAVGFIVAVSETIPENCPVGAEKIRPVTKIIDTEPLFTEEIFELAQWISKYYLCSIGEAVFSIIPSRGKRESSAAGFSFDSELSEKSSNTLSDEQEEAVKAITLSAQSGKADAPGVRKTADPRAGSEP